MDNTKICSMCRRVFPIDNFAKNAKMPDGKQYYCRDCFREYFKTEEHKAKSREAVKRYLLRKLQQL